MTKTELAEVLQQEIQETISLYQLGMNRTMFNRHFLDLYEDFKVRLQEQIEQSIEDEEQEFVEEDSSEAFGNGIMEGE